MLTPYVFETSCGMSSFDGIDYIEEAVAGSRDGTEGGCDCTRAVTVQVCVGERQIDRDRREIVGADGSRWSYGAWARAHSQRGPVFPCWRECEA